MQWQEPQPDQFSYVNDHLTIATNEMTLDVVAYQYFVAHASTKESKFSSNPSLLQTSPGMLCTTLS